MYKNQMLLQRIACCVMIFACALVFIYSLGLVTDLYGNNFQYYAQNPSNPMVAGAEIYYEIQDFNSQLTGAGLVLLLLALALLVLHNHTRRKYYIANYVAVGVNVVADIAVAAWALPNVIFYKEKFLQVDFETLDYFATEIINHEWTDSTFWFDAAYGVFAILLVAAIFLLFVTIYKAFVMNSEKSAIRDSKRKMARN